MLSCAQTTSEGMLMSALQPDLFYQSPLPGWIVDPQNLTILAANQQAEKLYQYTASEWVRLLFSDLLVHEIEPQLRQHLELANGQPEVFLHRKKNGDAFSAELFCVPVSTKNGMLLHVTALDVSAKVQELEQLASEKEQLKTFIEQSAEANWCCTLEFPVAIDLSVEQITDHIRQYAFLSACNENTARMLGRQNLSEVIGTRVRDLLNFDHPDTTNFIKDFLGNNYNLQNVMLDVTDLNGQKKTLLSNFMGIVERGYLIKTWGTNTDITEKKQTEEKIRLLASLVEETNDVLTALDLNWNHISWNKGAEKIFGLTAEQVIGKSIREFISDISYQNASRDEVRAYLNATGEWSGEMYFTRPHSKKPVTLLTNFKLLKDEDNAPVGYVFSGLDITERKEAELRLIEIENRFHETADSTPVGIWITDSENNPVYKNKYLLDFLGIQNPVFSWNTVIHPDDISEVNSKIRQTINKRLAYTMVYRIKIHTGAYRWIIDSGQPRFLSDGTFMGYTGSIVDIQDVKGQEERLTYMATLLENVSEIVITTDLNHHVLTWNQIAEDMFGITAEDIKGKYLYDEVDFDFGQPVQDVLKAFLTAEAWKGEVSFINKKGEKKYVQFTSRYIASNDGKRIAIMGMGLDITERKIAEEKTRVSEQFYRSLIADSANGVLITDASGTLKFASFAVKTILGFEPDDILGENCFSFIHPDDVPLATDAFQREVEQNPIVKSIQVRLKKSDGSWLWCLVRGHNLLTNPQIQGLVIYFHDDTLRKKANDSLRESEQRFRTLISDIQIGVAMLDEEEHIFMSNNEFQEIFMEAKDSIQGKKFSDVVTDVIDESNTSFTPKDCPIRIAIRTKEAVKDVVMGVYRPHLQDRLWIMVNASPILDEQNNLLHVIVTVKDITERKKLEQTLLSDEINHQKQLTQATIDAQERERREIGKELHDNFGQQLTTIKLFLDLAKTTADESTNEMISMGLKGITDVINGMRQMSRAIMPPTLGDLGLVDSVFDLIENINRTQAINIEFDFFEFNESLVPDNQQLMFFRIIQEQLNNIIKHAEAKNALIRLYNSETEAILEIEDDGKGFDVNNIQKGLGLINIKNRAEIFGGKKEIHTAPGEGCLLKVRVPGNRDLIL